MAQSHHEFVVQLNEYVTHTVCRNSKDDQRISTYFWRAQLLQMAQFHHEGNMLGYAWINAILGEKECVNRSTGLLPSAQVDVLYSIFTVCFFFTVTVSHHYISNDSISCNLLHFLIS